MKKSMLSIAGVGEPNDDPARTMADMVYRKLRFDIVWGVLPPGAPLRSDDLRETYSVGISPLREALSRLVAEHLVTSVGQRGFRVAPLSAENVFDTMENRVLIESEALRRSIEKGDLKWETQILAAAHALKGTPPAKGPGVEAEAWAAVHRHFHLTLISACGSAWLIKLAEQLYSHAERHRLRALRFAQPATYRDRPAEHDAIFQATLARNAKLALAELDTHYRRTAMLVVESLSGPQSQDEGAQAQLISTSA